MNETQQRPAAAPGRRITVHKKRHTHRLLAFFVILASLALFAGFGLFLHAVFSGEWPSAKSASAENPVIAVLDDRWTADLAACTTQQQMKTAIDEAVRSAAELHCTALAWTGRDKGGAAFFRDGTKTLETAGAVTMSDKFLSRFDPMQYLVRQAGAAGLPVYLLATDDSGAALAADALGALPEWETALAQKHGLTVLAENAAEESAVLRTYTAADGSVTILRADGDPAVLASAVQSKTEGAYGVMAGDYSALSKDSTRFALYLRYVSGGALPDLTQYWNGKSIAQTLAVSYPTEDNSTVNDASLFLMGTSDPDAELTMNGAAVARYGRDGVWGVLVTLSTGANTFALQNGTAALSYTVNYAKAASGGKVTPAADGTPGRPSPLLSSAVKVGNRLYLSGLLGNTAANKGDTEAQTVEILARVGRTLKVAGFDWPDLADGVVYLTDTNNFTAMNKGYTSVVKALPARATVKAGLVADGMLEIMFVASK